MSSSAIKTSRRTLWRRVLLGLITLSLLGLGTVLALSRFLDPEELAGWLEPRLETALSRDVAVGQVKVGLFPLGVRLLDLTLSDPTGLAPTLAQVEALELRVRILPLLRREIQLDRLTLAGLQADLRVDAEGRSNFGDLSTRPASESDSRDGAQTQQPFVFDFQKLGMAGGRIRYANARDSVHLEMEDIQVHAFARRVPGQGWQITGLSRQGVIFVPGEEQAIHDPVPMEVAFDLASDEGFESVSIKAGEIRSGGIALALTGEIRKLQDPVRSISLVLASEHIPLSGLQAALPDSVQDRLPMETEGAVAINLQVEGELGPEHLPTITGKAGLTQGIITLEGKRLAQDLSAELNLGPDWIVETQTRGTVLGGPFSLEGTATLGTIPLLDLFMDASPDLGTIGDFFNLPEGVTALGRLPSRLRITGPAGDPGELRFHGTLQAVGIEASHPKLGVPFGIPAGEVQIGGTTAVFTELPLLLGEDEVFLSGTLDGLSALLSSEETPHFDGFLRAARVDLPAISPRSPPDPELTYGKVAFAKVGDRPLGGRGFQAVAEELGLNRPESIPMAGSLDLRLDTLIDNGGRMENVRARLDFGPSFLHVAEASFRRFGGEIHTSVDLSLSPDESAPFSFSLAVSGLEAGDFLASATPLGDFVKGTISLELELVGTLDGFLLPDRPTLVGSGRFSLTDGGLASTPLTRGVSSFLDMESLREPAVHDWEGSFLLEDGKVLLADGTLQGAPGNPAVGGSVGLNGELSLRSAFQLPWDRLNTSALERLGVAGDIAGNVLQRPEVVQAILQIGGSVFDPTVETDPLSAVQTLGAAVEDEVRNEVSERIEAEKEEAERVLDEQRAEAQRKIEEQREELRSRATGFLRGLIQPRDSARTPTDTGGSGLEADTLLPDTLLRDTVGPDTVLLPDTVVPDTVKPDTVIPDTIRPDTLSGFQPIASPLERYRSQEYRTRPGVRPPGRFR